MRTSLPSPCQRPASALARQIIQHRGHVYQTFERCSENRPHYAVAMFWRVGRRHGRRGAMIPVHLAPARARMDLEDGPRPRDLPPEGGPCPQTSSQVGGGAPQDARPRRTPSKSLAATLTHRRQARHQAVFGGCNRLEKWGGAMIRSADLVATTAADETDKDRGLDVWALADTAALVGEARALRDGLQAFVVLNLADPGVSADNADATAALAEYSSLTLLPTPLEIGR